MVPLPRGISRHVVRIVRLGQDVYAVKQTREQWANREYRLLRDLRRLGLPAVEPVGVVSGREDERGEEIEPALVTRHLQYSLPYRSLFSHGLPQGSLPKIVDALVVLLVRLHLAGFFWGDVSLSNVLFRRSAGEFAAYLVDAETGELHDTLSDGQRMHDLEVALTNIYGELLDLQAGGLLAEEFEADDIVERVEGRYDGLWRELTGTEEYTTDEMWRIEQRMQRLNELGFDVDELDIVTDWDGATVRVQPKVVEANHHARDLQRLTGLDVEDNQARRLLNDLAAYTAHHDLGGESRSIVAHRWLTEVYEPITRKVPAELRGRLEPAEVFHEILEHRWFLSEQSGHPVHTVDAAESYIANVLRARPEEVIAGDVEGAETGATGDTEDTGDTEAAELQAALDDSLTATRAISPAHPRDIHRRAARCFPPSRGSGQAQRHAEIGEPARPTGAGSPERADDDDRPAALAKPVPTSRVRLALVVGQVVPVGAVVLDGDPVLGIGEVQSKDGGAVLAHPVLRHRRRQAVVVDRQPHPRLARRLRAGGPRAARTRAAAPRRRRRRKRGSCAVRAARG